MLNQDTESLPITDTLHLIVFSEMLTDPVEQNPPQQLVVSILSLEHIWKLGKIYLQ